MTIDQGVVIHNSDMPPRALRKRFSAIGLQHAIRTERGMGYTLAL